MIDERNQPSATEGPLFVRWGQESAPIAIELRFELVSRIEEELKLAEQTGIEIGGLLIGTLLVGISPTLRVDEVEMIRRRPQDGPIYTIDPRQHGRFTEVRRRAQSMDRAAIGFFRTHLRPGRLRPAIADRTLLSNEFKDDVYVLLLIEAREPHWAAFFIASHGELPAAPSVQEFRFNSAEFHSLPEVQPESLSPARTETKDSPRRTPWAAVSAILLIGFCACIAIWFIASGREFSPWSAASTGLGLAVTDQGKVLRISWNHAARELGQTLGATLVIKDGGNRSEVRLGLDELRLGSVEYEKVANSVGVTMTLDMPGSLSASQSIQWPPH